MKKLTQKEALKIHQALWTWLSQNPDKEKRDWPEWIINGGSTIYCQNFCPACEYNGQRESATMYCSSACIIAWPAGHGCQWINDTTINIKDHEIYNQWYYSKDSQVRASLATQIANLPLRKRRKTNAN